MLLLTSTADKVQVITDAAGTVKVHASIAKNAAGTITPDRVNTPTITTAATTDVVPAPASSVQTNVKLLSVRNTDASVAQNITVQHTDGTNVEVLWKGLVLAGEAIVFDQVGVWTLYDTSGIKKNPTGQPFVKASSADQAVGASVTAYVTSSDLLVPANSLKVGTILEWYITMSKTAASTAAMSADARVGTGVVGDASKLNLPYGASTAVADVALQYVRAVVRSLGASGQIDFFMQMSHGLNATGFGTNASPMADATATVDTTAAQTFGITLTTGAAHAITVKQATVRRYDPLS